MCDEETMEQINQINARLDHMDKARDESPLTEKIDKLIRISDRMESNIETVNIRSAETHKVLLGNGDPSGGLVYQFNEAVSDLKNQIKILQRDFNAHIDTHKEVKDRTTNFVIDILRPVVGMLLTNLMLIGIVWMLFGSKILELLKTLP